MSGARSDAEKQARRVEQDQIISAAIHWKRETDREGIELDTLSQCEVYLYRVVDRYMKQRDLK